MICANLAVTHMGRSLAFYCDLLGMEMAMAVAADRAMIDAANGDRAVFVMLRWKESELMLQTVESLSEEVPGASAPRPDAPNGTIFFRGYDGRPLLDRLQPGQLFSGPKIQWYGMLEVTLRDPDGHLICLAVPEGAAPDL